MYYWEYPRLRVLLSVHVNLFFCTSSGPEVTHFEIWIVESLVATIFYGRWVLQNFVLVVGKNVVFLKIIKNENFL